MNWVIGIGFGLLVVIIAIMARRQHLARSSCRDQPWMWRKDWAVGRIAHGSSMWVLAGLCVPTVIFVSTALYFSMVWGFQGGGVILLLVLWALSLVFVGSVIRAIIHRLKFGESAFEMRTVPAAVGGQLAGVIKIPTRVCPQEGFRLKLVCEHYVRHRAGSKSHTHKTVLWEAGCNGVRAFPSETPNQSIIPVEIDIPAGQPSYDDENMAEGTIWRLEVTADVPGVDYSASFDVPVFALADDSA